MKLCEIEINNFRNINHAVYQLGRINLWTGPNQTGKTNTILAVYWALSDFLMDGSSDYASFKPFSDTKAEVSVELRFDSFTLKKAFAEKWTKTRGSDEYRWEGHTTTYWIDGVKLKISEAKKELLQRLGLSGIDTGSFDLLRSLIDPYYFWKACDWKVLRSFIISICGDVSDDDVFMADPSLLPIQERLRTDRYDAGRTTKYYKQQLKQITDGISEYEGKIKGLQEIKDPSEEDVRLAETSITEIDKAIADLRSGSGGSRIMDDLQLKLRQAQIELKEIEASDREQVDLLNADLNNKISEFQEEIRKATADLDKNIRARCIEAENAISKAKQDINIIETDLQSFTKRRERLYEEYDRLTDWTAPEGQRCPHCGGILNQDHIDQLIKNNKEQIEACVSSGRACAAEIANAELKKKECEEYLAALIAEREKANADYRAATAKLYKMKAEADDLMSKKFKLTRSDRAINKDAEIDALRAQISAERDRQFEGEKGIESAITELIEKKGMSQRVLNAHGAYLMSLEKIDEIEADIKSSMEKQVETERKLVMINKYIQKKLQMFADHISSVFGEKMKFQLIQENIKEGSWNEVCVPRIIDKDTPVYDGSGSEQILTGIYFAECVKAKLNLPDLPYIFDECDKLDGAHLAAIDTNSQLLSTIVDDVHYETITLETRV